MATTDELVAQVRTTLDDVVEDYLVSDAQIVHALNQAQLQFAEDVLPIFTRANTYPYTAGNPHIFADDSIMKVRRAVLANGQLVRPITRTEMDLGYVTYDYGQRVVENWRTMTGEPRYLITDYATLEWRLVPTPTTDGTLTIEAYSYPQDLVSGVQDPEIPLRWHYSLVHGALARIYLIQDAELYNPDTALAWQAVWDRELAEAKARLERNRRGPTATRFNSTSVW